MGSAGATDKPCPKASDESSLTTGENTRVCHFPFLAHRIDIQQGETAVTRTDVEVLFEGLPEPIDLELDEEGQVLYWTDRWPPADRNSLDRAKAGEEEFVKGSTRCCIGNSRRQSGSG